jgi:hypothetical protein
VASANPSGEKWRDPSYRPLSTGGFVTLEKSVTVPAGVAEVRVVLSGFAPTDTHTSGNVVFDDVGIYAT